MTTVAMGSRTRDRERDPRNGGLPALGREARECERRGCTWTVRTANGGTYYSHDGCDSYFPDGVERMFTTQAYGSFAHWIYMMHWAEDRDGIVHVKQLETNVRPSIVSMLAPRAPARATEEASR